MLAAERPNILFIAIDDLVPTIGAYGDTLAQTPEIDTLASQGTTFLNHHVQWSVCGPSRAALTTSLMPEETGVTGFKAIRHPDFLPDVITLPQHFKNNGYETACSGKFHDNRTVGDTTGALVNNQYPSGTSVDDPASWSIPYDGAKGSGFSPSGKPAVDYTDQADSLYVDHDILTIGKSLIDTISAGDKPFFIAVGFKKPHLGFIAPKQYWDLYDTNGNSDFTDDFPLPTFTDHPANVASGSALEGTLDNNNEILGYEPFDVTGLPTEAQTRELRHGYYACVSFIDTLVGDLLDKLAATDDPVQAGKKMSETTIVVLWGDHGFYLGEHARWAKHGATERTTAAPFIVYDPRSPGAGAKSTSPVNTVDIYPTLCELAGLPIPEQPLSDTVLTGRPLRGRSLVPVLDDPSVSVNGGAISHFNKGTYGYSYRTERYRLIEWVDGSNNVDERNLFDYQGVGGLETVDISEDPAYASVLHQLSVAMRAEPTTQGMARLQASDAALAPVDLGVPALRVAEATEAELELAWPSTSSVTYRVLTTDDLLTSWESLPGYESLVGGSISVAIDADRGFYGVEVAANHTPQFEADPILANAATVDVSYSASIAGSATDPDAGASIAYSKLSGPTWLSVSTAGALTGTPTVSDLGANYFRVAATDEFGASQAAALQVTVEEAPGSGTTDTFTVLADTFAKEANPADVFGDANFIELKQMDASNFERIGYLQFAVTGVGTVTSAKLWLHSSTLTSEVKALATSNNLSDGTTPWTELNLIWNNKPSVGLEIGSGAAVAGQWFSIDVTSYITGNGTFSIALDEQSNDVGKLDSKDVSSGALAPYLEVVWE